MRLNLYVPYTCDFCMTSEYALNYVHTTFDAESTEWKYIATRRYDRHPIDLFQ